MKVGRDYVWWVSYSWTYEWLEEDKVNWIPKKIRDLFQKTDKK